MGLNNNLYGGNKYIIIRISFEGMGNTIFESEQSCCEDIIKLFAKSLKVKNKELSDKIFEIGKRVKTLTDLDEAINQIINKLKERNCFIY